MLTVASEATTGNAKPKVNGVQYILSTATKTLVMLGGGKGTFVDMCFHRLTDEHAHGAHRALPMPVTQESR